jgi:hypothetical protein
MAIALQVQNMPAVLQVTRITNILLLNLVLPALLVR